jgi:hypothetical protein
VAEFQLQWLLFFSGCGSLAAGPARLPICRLGMHKKATRWSGFFYARGLASPPNGLGAGRSHRLKVWAAGSWCPGNRRLSHSSGFS